MRTRIGVEQQLIRVEAVAVLGLVGPMHAIAVDGARAVRRQIAVPDFVGVFRKFDALEFSFAAVVEQAELDLGGVGAENRAKLVPWPSQVAPSGWGWPSDRRDHGGLRRSGHSWVSPGKSDPVQTLRRSSSCLYLETLGERTSPQSGSSGGRGRGAPGAAGSGRVRRRSRDSGGRGPYLLRRPARAARRRRVGGR